MVLYLDVVGGLIAAPSGLINDPTFIRSIMPYVVWGAVAIVLLLGIVKGPGHARRLRKNKAKNSRPSRSRDNELGSGDLATKTHLKSWLEPDGRYDTKLPVKGLKCSDGIALKDGNLIIPREERNRHILVIAKTGSGKTTRMILPILYNDCMCPDRSTIVLDSKPEMWDKLAGLTKRFNPDKRIVLFNPLDTLRSKSWNILSKVETDTDAKLIANSVIMATDNPAAKADSPFFRNNALQLLNAIMCGLLEDENDILSMPRVHELVHSGMKHLCDWLEQHPKAIRSSRTFVELARSGSQNADTIMSELGMRLSAWDLSAIRATTAFSEFDPEILIQEPTLFIIELRESELEMLRPMANVIVVELLRFLTKRAESCPGSTLPRPVGLVIDEFASALGRLPDIHVKLNTLRSRNVSIVGAIQSIGQIKANYDKDADSVLSGFSTKIFMPALDFQDAEWASKESGTMTVRFNVASKGKNKRLVDYFAHQNDNLQEQVQQRAVLTPDEIGRPADNISTLFLPNTPVFQGHLVPFFKVPEMLQHFEEGEQVEVRPREGALEYIEPEIQPLQTQSATPEASINFEQALGEVKQAIDYETADATPRQWWDTFEQANQNNLSAVINLAHELIRRKVKLAEFYEIYAISGTQDVSKVLHAIDRHLLEEIKQNLGWVNIGTYAKEWWIKFEEANQDNFPVVVELARELESRGVTIDDFFSAYVHSDFETIPEILGVVDRLVSEGRIGKKARKKSSVNSNGTTPKEFSNAAQTTEQTNGHGPADDVAVDQTAYKDRGFGAVDESKSLEPPQQNGLAQEVAKEPVSAVQSRATKTKDAANSVHVKSYYAMAEDLLQKGKFKDFDVLVSMASEDNRFNEDDLSELRAIKARYAEGV